MNYDHLYMSIEENFGEASLTALSQQFPLRLILPIAPAKFAQDLVLAKEYSLVLIVTFNCLLQDLNKRMNYNNEKLPQKLILPKLL